ncbi:universal stress protein [Amphritea sp. 1_MG-2023]|jgi:nucleotide-binding universal stress UspA family protein|uniref:universal stress protein n=1 Tax=Amphritea sp. 1_MG-2023 TaxID=3062670 RepID=UPI0026E355C4|nr:universal stress protein [Amphritea sp. 1_MG-2023]MDO6562150.1 universal stress protein [Amphritea sp. 1_MG-2023]
MLPDIDTILYASDITEGSRPAFRMAVKQAINNHARIVFLHALEPMDDFIDDFLPVNASQKHKQQLIDSFKKRIGERIEAFLNSELEDDFELPYEPTIQVSPGKPDQVILKAAKRLNASMIIMGDRETSSMSRVFLGSTAQKVIHHSEIPVLIVPLKKK